MSKKRPARGSSRTSGRGKRRAGAGGPPDPSVERRRFKTVLDGLGLRVSFDRMSSDIREQLFAARWAEPILRFDHSYPSDEPHGRLRETLDAAFRRARFRFDDIFISSELSVRDYWVFVPGLLAIVSNTARHAARDAMVGPGVAGSLLPKPKLPPAVAAFCAEAEPVLRACLDAQSAAFNALHEAVVVPLVERARLDGRLLHAGVASEPLPQGRMQVVMTVRTQPPQAASVTLDGRSRPAYRVGTNNEWEGVRWLSIDGGSLRPDWAGRTLSVHAQSHALRQLHARLNVPAIERFAEYWLYASLAVPNVVERQPGGDLLIEYRILDDRVGYLVATPLQDMLVVRTFLFLTMQPTPEARLLERKLKLTRADADWLGLTELGAFTQTDLRDDATLRPLLEACGCGHLFRLAEKEWATDALAPEPRPFADQVKKYLQMAA